MIQRLYIKNYAIISEIDIHFHEHLNVMTGETGAGKSIILEALSLILGDRADSSVILDDTSKCIIEGSFDISQNDSIKEKLAERSFDVEEEFLILRREITSNGKSRSFINDTPCTLNDLSYIQNDLIDINKQFDNQQIKNESYIIDWLDFYISKPKLNDLYSALYRKYKSLNSQLIELRERRLNLLKEHDYINFQLEEISNLNLKDGEIESLEEQIKVIDNQSEIKNISNQISSFLTESEPNVLSLLRKVQQSMHQLSKYKSEIVPYIDRIDSVMEEVKDISSDLSDNELIIELSESEYSELVSRYNEAQRLLKKHQLLDTQSLLDLKDQLGAKNIEFENLDELIIDIENQLNNIEVELKDAAKTLSENRSQAVTNLVPELKGVLIKLGLQSAQLNIQINNSKNYKPTGCDDVELLIDFNNTDQFLPLSKAGSGGELSRLLLAMKSIVGTQHSNRTIVFDEIDSAISGEIAKQVAHLIKNISRNNQVIVLTHQPQMAAKGDKHLHLFKQSDSVTNRNKTLIKTLSEDERIQYIAQMMSGEKISESVLNSAKEMIENK